MIQKVTITKNKFSLVNPKELKSLLDFLKECKLEELLLAKEIILQNRKVVKQ